MKQKETQHIEFKSSWREEHLKVISAFANSKGGTMIIGLDDQGNPVKLKEIDKLLENIPNIIRNKLGIIPLVGIREVENHETIEIIVSPSSVPISYHGKFYLRSGSTIQELKGNDLANFLMKKTGVTWDDEVEEESDLSILDEQALSNFKHYAADRLPALKVESDVYLILKKLNLVKGKKLKRAAILLFAREPQRYYAQSLVKIGRFLSDTDIQMTDLVEGNLFQQLQNSLEILRLKYLKSEIRFDGIHRRDILEYPYEALREAIINALIHRDYWGTSHIQIRVYSDKLTIMNEGGLPPEVPVEKLKTEHLSKPRNKLLASIFYYAGFIESWGRGTLKIVEKCVEQGLPEPDFKDKNGVVQVIFKKDIYTTTDLKKLGLNERQIKEIFYVKENGKITNKIIQEMFGVSRETATRDLSFLVEKDLLKSSGIKGAGAFYVLK